VVHHYEDNDEEDEVLHHCEQEEVKVEVEECVSWKERKKKE